MDFLRTGYDMNNSGYIQSTQNTVTSSAKSVNGTSYLPQQTATWNNMQGKLLSLLGRTTPVYWRTNPVSLQDAT